MPSTEAFDHERDHLTVLYGYPLGGDGVGLFVIEVWEDGRLVSCVVHEREEVLA